MRDSHRQFLIAVLDEKMTWLRTLLGKLSKTTHEMRSLNMWACPQIGRFWFVWMLALICKVLQLYTVP